MVLLANRVSAPVAAPMLASTSVTPSARAASATAEKISSHCERLSTSGIGAPDLDVAEARWRGAVPGPHHLLRLSLAAIRCAPYRPVFRSRDGRAGIPELRADAAVAGVLKHAHA